MVIDTFPENRQSLDQVYMLENPKRYFVQVDGNSDEIWELEIFGNDDSYENRLFRVDVEKTSLKKVNHF